MITSARVSRFASVTEIIKYVEKLLLFACLVFLEPYVKRYTSSKRVLFSHELKCCVLSIVTKVEFQVLCLQVGGSRKISEVQVRVCYYW